MTFRRSIQALVLVVLGTAAGCTVKNSSADGGASSCAADTTVMCSQGSGWSCDPTNSASPADSNPLVCSKPTVSMSSGDKIEYCCVASTGVSSTCSQDSTVSCTQGATGFTCTSSDTPDQNDTSLACSTGTKNGANTQYCCLPYAQSSGTCTQDNTVMCPTASSYGFSCAGTDTPAQANSSLTCSSGTASNGKTLFCCQ